MKNNLILTFCAAAMLLAGVGCSSIVTIAPSSTPITVNDTYTKLGPASGSSTTVLILGIPFGPGNPSKNACAAAIAASGGNALIEVTEDYSGCNLLIIGFYTTTIKGTAIKFERKGTDVVK